MRLSENLAISQNQVVNGLDGSLFVRGMRSSVRGHWMKKHLGIVLLMCLVVGVLTSLVACGGGGGITSIKVTPLPTLAQRSQPASKRPPLLIQFCNDDTGSFPRKDFQGANQLMASSLIQAVSANQQGVTLYATAITHNTFDPVNTLNPAFKVPDISAFDAQPTPVPTHAAANPVTDPATATAVSQQTADGIIAYKQSVAEIDKQIKAAKDAVTKDVKRLTSWNPSVDTIATSILGCFQLAASRFQGQTGTKLIYIASDLENNTDVDYTQSFVSSHGLAGVIVHVIYLVSPSATRDHEKRAQWCPFLKSAGATAVLFSDPTSSPTLTNVFNKDLAVQSQPCS